MDSTFFQIDLLINQVLNYLSLQQKFKTLIFICHCVNIGLSFCPSTQSSQRRGTGYFFYDREIEIQKN